MPSRTANANAFQGFNDESDHIATGIGARKLNNSSKKGSSFDKIPIIDFTDARSPSLEARKRLAREIFDACAKVGFFYAKNHGIDDRTIERTQKEARRFFTDQSHEEKMELDMSRNATEYYGYAPMKKTMPDGAIKRRMYETMHWGYEPSLDPAVGKGPPAEYNFWPTEEKLPGFKPQITSYYTEVLGLARTILRLFALALDLEEDFFDQFSKHPGVLLALNYYAAAAPQNPEGSGMYAHSDLEVFTMLLQDDVKSLEVLNHDGDWIPADPVPGTFVVNVGDTLSMWTNNIFQSTIHRAYNTEGETRCSIPFFFGADHDKTMETLPSCITADNPAKFEPINIGYYQKKQIHQVYPEGKAGAVKAPEIQV